MNVKQVNPNALERDFLSFYGMLNVADSPNFYALLDSIFFKSSLIFC